MKKTHREGGRIVSIELREKLVACAKYRKFTIVSPDEIDAILAHLQPSPSLAKVTDEKWLVVRRRECDPHEVWEFSAEADARAFHNRAQEQWCACWLARVVKEGAQQDAAAQPSPDLRGLVEEAIRTARTYERPMIARLHGEIRDLEAALAAQRPKDGGRR